MQEKAYGIIPLRKKGHKWQVLLIHHVKGNYWAFPKGHTSPGELPKETAVRELFEETHLKVKNFLVEEPLYERYYFYRGAQHIDKEVFYFLAEVDGDIQLQEQEAQASVWIDLAKAKDKITFPQSKDLVNQILKKI